jgi:hypothetical protein
VKSHMSRHTMILCIPNISCYDTIGHSAPKLWGTACPGLSSGYCAWEDNPTVSCVSPRAICSIQA